MSVHPFQLKLKWVVISLYVQYKYSYTPNESELLTHKMWIAC